MEASIEAISRIWCAVLDLDSVEPDVNFFELGGQSILVLAVHEHLEQLAGRPIPVEDLFHHSTVRAQARYLAGQAEVRPAARAVSRELLMDRARRVEGGDA